MTLEERIAYVNSCAMEIEDVIAGSLKDGHEPTAGQAASAIASAIGMLNVLTISIVEIADSVGKLASLAAVDLEASIKTEADNLATVKRNEETKRSFLGQRSK